MGEAKRKKAAGIRPIGFGDETVRVDVNIPTVFRYNPRTGDVYYPRNGKSALLIKDPQIVSMVTEAHKGRQRLSTMAEEEIANLIDLDDEDK